MAGEVSNRSLQAYLRASTELALSCEPADRELAEEGVRLTYKAARRKAPQRIIWCGSPGVVARQIAASSASRQIGSSIKTTIVDDVRNSVRMLGRNVLNEALRTPLSARHRTRNTTVAAYCSAAVDDAHEELFRVSVRTRHFATRLMGCPSILPRSSFREIAAGPDELAQFGVYRYLHDVHRWRTGARRLAGLWKIASSAGWLAPFENVCWLSERPVFVRTDAHGRLHSPDGPAVRYPDGATSHVWKGVRVPAWMIEHPECITDRDVSAVIDPVLRDTMIDIMTPERFIANGGARRVSSDETGILWRRRWTYRGVTLGTWSAVEVVDGTPAADGPLKRHILRVPPHVCTAREAVAWTYGSIAQEHAALLIRR